MDRISDLPDSLLLRILSLVPTNDLVSTCVLSKRWETLWMLVPKLKYNVENQIDSRFVNRFLLLHKAPVLESLCLKIHTILKTSIDIEIWVRIAIDRRVRKLHIDYSSNDDPISLPRSFYTCETLVVLKLNNASLVDFSSSSSVCFRSLKTLHLLFVKYSNDKSFEALLSSCSSLNDLVVKCFPNDNISIFTIKVPSLQSLSLDKSSKDYGRNCLGFVINAPSLKYFNFIDYRGSFCLAEDMPELVEANVDIVYDKIDNFLRSLTYVKRLWLCSTKSNASYPIGTTFHQLVHLKLCTCEAEWLDLLVCLLKVTPKLRVLKLKRTHKDRSEGCCWNQPDSVPDCLLTSLEIFEWKRYKGTQDQRNLAAYILRSSCCLKTAKIHTDSDDIEEQLEMIKKLAFSTRASTSCELAFD